MRGLALCAVILAACGPTTEGDDDTCAGDLVSCGGACVDSLTDEAHCGDCATTCDATQVCNAGTCQSAVTCTPSTTEACYSGPVGTEGLGPCHGGTRTCSAAGTWGACAGEVVPTTEVCGNGLDEDCTGVADDELDEDGDGFTTCDGDCCDEPADGCTEPTLVNPGAFDVSGNALDDDCDGTIDNGATATCDAGLASSSSTGLDYARAIELCQTATESDGRWGVISAELVRADGSGAPAAVARSIRGGFGGTSVQAGASLAELSTGHAADQGDTNPAFAAFQGGVDNGITSNVPADWLAANGGNFPNAPGCPEPQGGTTGYDPVMLRLRIRVPTNARSFSLSTNFFSSEYPEWVCSPYNDFFVVLLDSTWAGSPANPPDRNLAIYTAPSSAEYPVGVNLAFGDTGLFRECLNGPTGCGEGSVAGNTTTCTGTAGLSGTGMDIANPPPQFSGDVGWCGSSNLAGGGTGWLLTSGNVVGGEIITVRIATWDTGDQWYDSVVLLDNWQWSLDAAEPGTVIE